MTLRPDAETELAMVHESWRNAAGIVKLMRSGDRAGALALASGLEFNEMGYLTGSLGAMVSALLTMVAQFAQRITGQPVDADEYLSGLISGLAMMNAENNGQGPWDD